MELDEVDVDEMDVVCASVATTCNLQPLHRDSYFLSFSLLFFVLNEVKPSEKKLKKRVEEKERPYY